MQFPTELQEPFTYSFLLVIILIIIIILCIVVFLFKDKIMDVIRKNTIEITKKRYLKQLDELLISVNDKKIDNRNAYSKISNIARHFIKHVTGIDVLTISLSEARKLNIKDLESLMEECYPPEFAKQSTGDVISSINNTRRIIEEWN